MDDDAPRAAEGAASAADSLVPWARRVDLGASQARQFEYSREWRSLMAVGTCEGEVLAVDWERGAVLQRGSFLDEQERRQAAGDAYAPVPVVLALAWMRSDPRLVLAACTTGHARMFRADPLAADPGAAGRPAEMPLVHDYGEVAPGLTSVHCNSTDELLVASGDQYNVSVYNVETGARVRHLRSVHKGHINISRFANTVPSLLLTCSFDKTLKMWDVRVPGRRPIYTRAAEAGNVMVTFSPNDECFLASGIDNDVRQYSTVDGCLRTSMAIPRTGSHINYTRSYYGNGGDVVISAGSNQSVVHVCSPATGELVSTFDVYEGRRSSSLYVQSLRPCHLERNRLGLLVFNRYHARPYELVDVDLARDAAGEPNTLPYHYTTLYNLGRDLASFRRESPASYTDVEIVCSDGAVLRAGSGVLATRWRWFREARYLADQDDGKEAGGGLDDHDDAAAAAALDDDDDAGDDALPLDADSEPGSPLGLDEDSDGADDAGAAGAGTGGAAAVRVRVRAPRALVSLMLAFVYSDRVDEALLTPSVARALYPLTRETAYCLPRLGDVCLRYLRGRLTLTTAPALLRYAEEEAAEGLARSARAFLAAHHQWYADRGAALPDEVRAKYLEGLAPVRSPNGDLLLELSSMGNSVVRDGAWCYVIGGFHTRGMRSLAALPAYHVPSAVWSLLPAAGDVPAGLCWHAAARVVSPSTGRASVIAFGGDLSDEVRDDLYELDLGTMVWRALEAEGPAPAARRRHTATAVGTEVWIYGGSTHRVLLPGVAVFDAEARRWRRVHTGGVEPHPRFGHSATYVPELGILVFLGGFTYRGLAGMEVHVLDVRTHMWSSPPVAGGGAYNPATGGPVPRASHAACAVSVGGRPHIAVFGGSTTDTFAAHARGVVSDDGELCDLWLLSVETWRWRLVGPAAAARLEEALATGEGADGALEAVAADEDVLADGGALPGWPAPRSASGAVAAGGGRVALIGGWSGDRILSDAHEFDLGDEFWTERECRVSGTVPEPPLVTRSPSLLPDMRRLLRRHLGASLRGGAGAGEPLLRFVVGGRSLHLSKLVLAARAPHVRALLASNMRETAANEVVLDDVRLPVFLFVVHFLYTGDLLSGMLEVGRAVPPAPEEPPAPAPWPAGAGGAGGDGGASVDDLLAAAGVPPGERGVGPTEVLVAAGRLSVQSLLEVMEEAVAKQLAVSNVAACLAFADYYHLHTLLHSAVMLAVVHFDEVDLAPAGEALARRVAITHRALLGRPHGAAGHDEDDEAEDEDGAATDDGDDEDDEDGDEDGDGDGDGDDDGYESNDTGDYEDLTEYDF